MNSMCGEPDGWKTNRWSTDLENERYGYGPEGELFVYVRMNIDCETSYVHLSD